MLSQLLAEFETEMVAAGAGHMLAPLQPGLEPDIVRTRLGEIGMAPSREVLAWFAWRNGSEGHLVLPGKIFYSLDEGIGEYEQADRGEYDWQWREAWLPLTRSGNMNRIVVDCREDAEASAVRCVAFDSGLFSDSSLSAAPQPSLCVMVSWWIEALRAGIYAWEPAVGDWTWDRFNQIPPERDGLG